MTSLHVIFYIFAAIAVGGAMTVISVKNPVYSVLALVLTFFAMAAIWMMLSAEFLSLILLLVYVGAVMTLFLFVIMMLNINQEDASNRFIRFLPFGIIIVLLMIGLIFLTLNPHSFNQNVLQPPVTFPVDYNNIHALGSILYTQYAYPFEIAGVLLLSAIVAAITLALRKPRSKVQDVAEQVETNPANRVRMVDVSPESKIR